MRPQWGGQPLPPLGVVLALLLPGLAGCSDLPVIAPDDPTAPPLISAPVPLTGARGPLTAAQSAAILTRLKGISEIERVFTTSGRFDLLLQIAASNTQLLDQVLDQIGALTGVKSSESLIHLSTRLDRAV